jgi:restriction system protein
MAIPDYQTLMRPLLAKLADGQVHALKELKEALTAEFGLTPDETVETLPSGRQTVISNRIGWAKTYLDKAGLLTTPKRAHYQITERGQQALQECPECIDNDYLSRFDDFQEFQSLSSAKKGGDDEKVAPAGDTTPDEQIAAAYQALNGSLADDILSSTCAASPSFFEQLVVDLMLAMGYGGSRKEAGQATQYTSDGGIDGIIKDDPLGLETIYLQAKRYNDKTVGRPEVQSFAGALDMKRAKKGVFITTSKFSADALEFVSVIEKKIVLIDGPQLADLMIQHNLGVTRKEVYEIKQIDSDYFNEDE